MSFRARAKGTCTTFIRFAGEKAGVEMDTLHRGGRVQSRALETSVEWWGGGRPAFLGGTRTVPGAPQHRMFAPGCLPVSECTPSQATACFCGGEAPGIYGGETWHTRMVAALHVPVCVGGGESLFCCCPLTENAVRTRELVGFLCCSQAGSFARVGAGRVGLEPASRGWHRFCSRQQ